MKINLTGRCTAQLVRAVQTVQMHMRGKGCQRWLQFCTRIVGSEGFLCVYFTWIVHVFYMYAFLKCQIPGVFFLKAYSLKVRNEYTMNIYYWYLNILTKQLKEMFQYTFIINWYNLTKRSNVLCQTNHQIPVFLPNLRS